MPYDTILTDTHANAHGALSTGVITLNRPKQLNALNDQLMDELGHALLAFDRDEGIGCIVIKGGERAFAAGADIGLMKSYDFMDAFLGGLISKNWETLRQVRKPVVAAVAGFALGGGCELAMMCDIVIAADTAKFGQPEVKLGVVPGAGGTQRLPRAIGKAKAMDMVLTSRMMDAAEAERSGLVSRVVAADQLVSEAMSVAEAICALSMPSIMLAKECVNRAYESPLSEGLTYERRMFHALFGTHDQREGMGAFLDKRKASFKQR